MAMIPGGVTSNVVGSTYHPQTAEGAAMERQLLERQWELEDRNWGLAREKDAKALGEWQKNEDEAKMKAAYEMFYAPMAQSQWDLQQGGISGVDPNHISGTPQAGYGVYKKQGPYPGQQPYEYRKDTNLPNYQQSLDYAYEMWKAGQMMGAEDWKQQGAATKLPGGGVQGGSGQSY